MICKSHRGQYGSFRDVEVFSNSGKEELENIFPCCGYSTIVL